MAEEAKAGEAAAPEAAEEQESSQVASEKSPDQKSPDTVSQDAKTDKEKSEEKSEEKSKEKSEEKKDNSKKDDPSKKEEKPEPFHKHPAWQRMQRKMTKSNAENSVMREQLGEMAEIMKELVAEKRGEEYKPSKKDAKVSIPDAEELLDSEMEKFLESNEISADEETAITNIAKEYAYDVADKKVYLPPSVAYKIYKERTETSPGKKTVSTKPSSKATEKNITGKDPGWKPAKTVGEAADRAQVLLDNLQSSD